MEHFDALIVGGGPAGSTAAWQLRRAGMNVAVLDKQTFPRDKVCAGWVTPAVVAELELDVEAYREDRVFQPIHGFRTGPIGRPLVETRYAEPISYGIRRVEFDHYLLERSGAALRTGEKLARMERRGGEWVVNGAYRTPLVVGAGGHFCPVARRLGAKLGASETIVAAHEVEFAMTESQRARCAVAEDTPELFFCPDLQGYGWVFRKQDVLNVGLGREDNHNIADHVRRFCDWLAQAGKVPADMPVRFKGHAYLLHGRSRRRAVDDGVLLVGDAIGLAYTRSGEGIRPAVESAFLAVRAILRADGAYDGGRLAPYAAALDARFGSRGQAPEKEWVPPWLREAVAARLLGNRWFSKNVLLERWFLHTEMAPLTGAR